MLLTLLQSGGTPSTATIAWIKIAGVWRLTIVYIKISGVWKMSTPKIKITGIWK
jgi:hypothetical protein